MSIDPKDSPLNRATQINRDVADHLTAVQEDAFSDEAEFTEVVEDDGIDAFSEDPTPPRERKTSPPEPDFQDGDFEEDFGAFNAGPQVNPEDEEDREIFAAGILDAIRTGLPYAVHSFTKLSEDKYERYHKQKAIPKGVLDMVKELNREQKQKLDANTAYYTDAMKRPLQKVLRNRGVTPPPEMMLIGLTVGLIGSTAGLVQEIRDINRKTDLQIEREMELWRAEMRAKNAQKPQRPDPTVAEDTEEGEESDLAEIISEEFTK